MFLQNLVGLLMRVEEDEITRYKFEVWFDYTREAMNTIGEGTMIAVPNFASSESAGYRYSILEVTSILPMHYALGNDISGYPGFVSEAAKNAGLDWLSQESESTEETTKIRCLAIPTNLEIIEDDESICPESNIPMVGHTIHILNTEKTEEVANLNLDLERDNLIEIGHSTRDQDVRTFLDIEGLLKVHFGIFGFTGAGKSNLLSTLIAKLLDQQTKPQPVKILFFDLMGEYTGLLVDLLTGIENAIVLNIGARTLPESVLNYYQNASQDNLKKATIDYVRTMILPKRLKRHQDKLHRPIAIAIKDNKIKIHHEENSRNISSVIRSIDLDKGNIAQADIPRITEYRTALLDEFGSLPATQENLTVAAEQVEGYINLLSGANAQRNFRSLHDELLALAAQPQEEVPERMRISMWEIVKLINSDENSLIIVQSHSADDLRDFASELANRAYEARRRTGQIDPIASFIFDEADEFIPQRGNETQNRSRAAVMTLARRGRKFGLGIGIATQRIRYLDTSILAQPHTYFISKLPRKSDRDAITEAFGMSEEMFRQTFKFKKGDWLLASYDAAGLEAIPIPIHAENAEDRLSAFIDDVNSTG